MNGSVLALSLLSIHTSLVTAGLIAGHYPTTSIGFIGALNSIFVLGACFTWRK